MADPNSHVSIFDLLWPETGVAEPNGPATISIVIIKISREYYFTRYFIFYFVLYNAPFVRAIYTLVAEDACYSYKPRGVMSHLPRIHCWHSQ
jgi:hypothetical protein